MNNVILPLLLVVAGLIYGIYGVVAYIARHQAHEPYGFPTGEPRGRVHFSGSQPTARLVKGLRAGEQPKGRL